jgi:carbon storage regulator CsrA
MLVLSRKKDESIILDGQIEIQVLKVKGNTVRLGIKAPAQIKILRGELSPFDVDSEVENDSKTRADHGNGRRGLEMMTQEITIPNPFAIANAG